jgi:addiction module RelE/StbE family toxin
MKVRHSRTFKKQFLKLTPQLQQKFAERLRLWLVDPTSPQLRVHPLSGNKKGYWSMTIGGDLRVLYYFESEQVVVLALIGTHSQLY